VETSGAPEAGTGSGRAGGSGTEALGVDGVDLDGLVDALDGADDLDPDARILLLTRVEAAVADALRGLDGL